MTDLDDFGRDFVRKAVWAARLNLSRASGVWSTGERLAVALRDATTLLELRYSWSEAVERVCGGMTCSPADFEQWLGVVRSEVGRELDVVFAAEVARDLDGGW